MFEFEFEFEYHNKRDYAQVKIKGGGLLHLMIQPYTSPGHNYNEMS